MKLEQHEVGRRRVPWVTLGLALVCGGVFAAPWTHDMGWTVVAGSLEQVSSWSHVLSHADSAHLLGSVALLLLLGIPLERRWGSLFFAPVIALAALAAGAAWAWRSPNELPVVGLAGIVAALAGATLVRFRRGLPLRGYVPGREGVRGVAFALPAAAIPALWYLGDVAASAGAFPGVTQGVTWWGQLAGATTGLVLALVVEWGRLERHAEVAAAPMTPERHHHAIESALSAREAGNLNEALAILADALAAGAHGSELIVHYWQMASFAGKPRLAAPALLSLIEKELAAGERRIAVDRWCELVQRIHDVDADPRLLLQLTPLLTALDRDREAVRTLQLAVCDPGLTPGLALRAVDVSGELDPACTLRAARLALTSADLHDTKRTRLQQLTRDLAARGVREAEPRGAQAEQAAAERLPKPARPRAQANPAPMVEPTQTPDSSVAPPGEPPLEVAEDASSRPQRSDADREAADQHPSDEVECLDALGPDALDLDDMPAATPGLALHGLDLEADEQHAVSSLVDDTPSTAVDLGLDPREAAAAPPISSSYSSEDDDDTTGPIDELLNPLDALAMDTAHHEPRFSDAKVVDAIPTALAADRLILQQPGGRRGHVEFARVDAISVAAVEGMAERPVVLLDLLGNWTSLEGGPLRIIRMRSDRFDAHDLVPDAVDAIEALKMLSQILLEQCAAVALPDPLAAIGQPFRVCAGLSDYEREILQLDR